METLYIVVPAYNEEENICQLVEDWHPIVEQFGDDNSRLLVINDGSKDQTLAVLQQLEEKYPLLQPMSKPNGGHGSTVLFGYRNALDAGADWIFQTDSDGQTLPSEFKGFWDARNQYDAIIGVRSKREDGWKRKFVEFVLCRVLKHYFGVKVPDANAPFRLMSSDCLRRHIGRLPKDYNLPNAVLTAYFVMFGEKVHFSEVTFRPRQGGVNSINIPRIVGIGKQALKDFRMLSKEAKEELNAQ